MRASVPGAGDQAGRSGRRLRHRRAAHRCPRAGLRLLLRRRAVRAGLSRPARWSIPTSASPSSRCAMA
ncbi:MAG: hypothetical protein MZW92_42910 [Comamonadaceae bacterium]|nr:hypothetical protein [Comamonadaceae bacterium]